MVCVILPLILPVASRVTFHGSRFKSIIIYIIEQNLRRRGGVCVVPNHGTTMIIRPLMTFLIKRHDLFHGMPVDLE